MAGPPDHRALPASTWRPRDPALGAEPRDGDFARLLEAASSPRAHRMKVDPEVEAWGSTSRAARRAPYGSPGMNWGRTLPLPGRTDAPSGPGTLDRDASSAGTGAAAMGATGVPDADGFGAGAATGPSRRPGSAPWAGRPLRDRVVAVLFAIAGLWILFNVIDASTRGGGSDLGVLVVLAAIAFFVLRSRLRGRRPPSDR